MSAGTALTWLSARRRLVLIGLALLALAVAIAVFGGALATRVYLDQAASRVQTTLRLAVAVLEATCGASSRCRR
jgi:C4-dicarboxylate-specific signal transduction histidine kinase